MHEQQHSTFYFGARNIELSNHAHLTYPSDRTAGPSVSFGGRVAQG